ncbi:hypothetical protein L2E82_30796 [Cichorium intybus]|uniref:Uncharacterized protein n=1 Tax=Cichorium intybus TaxID=13427 RepID=A0ACB9D1N4_CICIN|nr:hypothetical protein L2E82_30796 [Cichorium intybus]
MATSGITESAAGEESSGAKYKGLLGTVATIAKEEGLLALWKGSGILLILQLCTIPLDTAKVRLQLQKRSASGEESSGAKYDSEACKLFDDDVKPFSFPLFLFSEKASYFKRLIILLPILKISKRQYHCDGCGICRFEKAPNSYTASMIQTTRRSKWKRQKEEWFYRGRDEQNLEISVILPIVLNVY